MSHEKMTLEIQSLDQCSPLAKNGLHRQSLSLKGNYSLHTHVGIGYKNQNEDGYLVLKNGAFVFDGVGGSFGGAQATRLAQQSIAQSLAHSDDLVSAFHTANHHINQSPYHKASTVAIGYTLKTGPNNKTLCQLVYAGDARAQIYRLNQDGNYELFFKTADQSPVTDLLLSGQIKNSLEMRTHQLSHVVYQGLGGTSQVKPAEHQLILENNDLLLLSTDGYHDNISEDEQLHIVNKLRCPHEIQKTLFSLALQKMQRLKMIREKIKNTENLLKEIFDKNSLDFLPIPQCSELYYRRDGKTYNDKGQIQKRGMRLPLDEPHGLFCDRSGIVTNNTGEILDSYKCDNITLMVHRLDPQIEQSIILEDFPTNPEIYF